MTRCVLVLLVFLASISFADRPNIVWIVSEDNSAEWLRLYDPHGAEMPNIEKLAKDGLVFNHAYSCGVVCSVARSTIISGCYAPRLGVQYHRKQRTVPMPEGLHMFPWYLRKAGYYTTNCAKEDYNFDASEKAGVWDESSKKASYRNRKSGQPFFHVQNFETTHESRLHPPLWKDPKMDSAGIEVMPYHPDTQTFRETYARYLELHAQVDQEMGKLIAQLEEDGLLDDTFIFYYGDHGGVLPRGKGYAYENGLHVPMVVYVPKNFQSLAPAPRGSRVDGFVQFIDLSATVLNLAGVEMPEGIDGQPFLGKGVSLDELNARDFAFGYADRFDEKYDLVRTIRKGRFEYMRSYQPFNFDGLYNEYRYKMLAYQEWRKMYNEGKLSEAQRLFFEPRPPESLYDMETDPYQIKNLAGDPAYASVLVEMRALMQKQVKSMPDLSFIPEPVFLAEGSNDPVGYGQQNRQEIERLVEIADLSLKPFPEAREQISRALSSGKPWERYWGLIACSSFGRQASPFFEKADALAKSDPEPLVRVRAAEFLGLSDARDPRPVIEDVLCNTDDPAMANLVLNTVVVLKDSEPGYAFDMEAFSHAAWAHDLSERRLDYLDKVAE